MSTTFKSVENNAQASLSTAIDADDTTILLTTGEGANLPSSGAFWWTLDDEVILISSRSTDTLTVGGRGQQGTSAASHDVGAIGEVRWTKSHVDAIHAAINAVEGGAIDHVAVDSATKSTMKINDSGANTVVSALDLFHMTSNTPAAGLGVKLVLGAEDSAGNAEVVGELQGYFSTVTDGSEQGVFLLRVKNAGVLQDALLITVGANSATVGSNQLTVTLWNVATSVTAFSAATAIIVGAATGTFTVNNAVLKMNGGTFQSVASAQWLLQHAPASGGASIRFYPAAPTTGDTALVDFFRQTNTTANVSFRVLKGDGTNTFTFAVVCGASPTTNWYDGSGVSQANLAHATGNLTLAGDIAVNGGDMTTTVTTFNMLTTNVTTANLLSVATSIIIGAATGTLQIRNAVLQVDGDLKINTVGKGLYVKEGTNATSGTATLVAGTVVVNTTKVTANSRIQLTGNADGGTPGWLRVSARTAGTSFTITSSNVADTSTVAWFIVEPA